MSKKLLDFVDTTGVDLELWFTPTDPNGVVTAPAGSPAFGAAGMYVNLGGTVWSLIPGSLAQTDATSTEIIATTAFTSGTVVWSSALNTRDYSAVSVWFNPVGIGGNTSVALYVQWSDDGSTIPFDSNNGTQQTDTLLSASTDGTFKPKDYAPTLTTATSELATGRIVMLTYPKKGGSFRYGVMGNSATGTFNVRAQRLA